jgi:2-polyprenyl-3-methyl-5-hydroxy-6-metoxy-1,4-benzoquinol methylase
MAGSLGGRIAKLLSFYPRRANRREFERQTFKRFTERPAEFAFLFRKLTEVYPRTILDVGSGTSALPQVLRKCGFLVTATDNTRDYWPRGMFNRHYHILDDDITATRLTQQFDFITCISVLEHIEKSEAAVRNMIGLLKPGGHLLLTFPYNERAYTRNVYSLPGSGYGQAATYITQAYSRAELTRWLAGGEAFLVDQEYWQFFEGEQWTVGPWVIPPRQVGPDHPHQLTCVLIRRKPA